MSRLTITRLKKLLSYNSKTGLLRWLVRPRGGVRIGDVAGCKHHTGYIFIKIDGRTYLAHRLAWAIYHGVWPRRLDHKNRIKSDNRMRNLRLATRRQNQFNRKVPRNNLSGTTGVRWIERDQKWLARIQANGRSLHLGSFSNRARAIRVRRRAEKKYFGKFAPQEIAA